MIKGDVKLKFYGNTSTQSGNGLGQESCVGAGMRWESTVIDSSQAQTSAYIKYPRLWTVEAFGRDWVLWNLLFNVFICFCII